MSVRNPGHLVAAVKGSRASSIIYVAPVSAEATEFGAFAWSPIRRFCDADAVKDWQRCEPASLHYPHEVFTQLFHEQANNGDGIA